MNILNKIRAWWSALFFGMKGADDAIFSSQIDETQTIGAHQVKDIHRVAPSLLKGEITQEVVDLRYRDYKVSENSRSYHIEGDRVIKGKKQVVSTTNYPRFTVYNHELYKAFDEEVNVSNESYTLKILYCEQSIFKLEKYCDRFLVDKDTIKLTFSAQPNRNLITSKAFINYLTKRVVTNLEHTKLQELSFISYKISVIPNYWRFKFKDAYLVSVESNENEISLIYKANSVEVEDLTEKYISEELERKYQEKAPKYLPSDIQITPIEYHCSECGKVITKNEGDLNKEVNGKFCCTECLFNNFIENENSDRTK